MSSTKHPVRVRFAPSPTGYLHVGAMRSALFNFLWARHNGGTFVLRLEDTDRARLVADAADQIQDSLDALGIPPDEGPRAGGAHGPYTQSERLDIYREHAATLEKSGALYRCWCSPERLAKLREDAQKAGVAFKYDRHCLRPENHKPADAPHVLRFRIPDEPATVSWYDAVRGRLEFKLEDLDDFVAVKADGYPTYQFANVVDDHLMAITHVLRADEWIPSTPKHILLYQAFDWSLPVFGHLPAVLGATGGKKLSKRDGALSVQEYTAEGYLPEALRSFLATLGWNDGTTQEIYTTDELIAKFTLDRIQKSPARFDKDRLTWINGLMIRQMPLHDLARAAQGFWPPEAAHHTPAYLQAVLGLLQERLKYLAELQLPELTTMFFTDPDPKVAVGMLPHQRTGQSEFSSWLQASIDTLSKTDAAHFTADHLNDLFRNQLATGLGLGKNIGPMFTTLRIALTASNATPPLFDTMAVLGRETTLRRLRAALAQLEK